MGFEEDETENKFLWIIFMVFLESLVVSLLTKFYTSVVIFTADRENHGTDK